MAYEDKIRRMNRGLLASDSAIYRKSPRPYVMLVLTHLIAYTCFPSIIIYKNLPGHYFASPGNSQKSSIQTVAWMGHVNVGSFLIIYAIAILLASKRLRPEQVDL